jgi:cell wall-associated NlpC family hydrolase
VIAEGQKYLGTPYVLGGAAQCKPYKAMDCSCFTMTVYSAFGIALPDNPGAQMGYGTPVSGAPIAGDLLFWSENGSGVITHVGIAMGDGTTLHASVFAGPGRPGDRDQRHPGIRGGAAAPLAEA